MRPPNYHQARKQKEQSRKLRQNEKQQRRTARVKQTGDASPGGEPGQETQRPEPAPAPAKN